MGWSIGYDPKWTRDIGYGVPAVCDHPDCNSEIDRGLSYVCGGEPYGGDNGCGLYFCSKHLGYALNDNDDEDEEDDTPEYGPQTCERCGPGSGLPDFKAKPDVLEWITHKLTDESWGDWRRENPNEVEYLRQRVAAAVPRL